ncbi:MAG: hypothetical protein COC16_03905 [Lutibacter sp.]|nr:MAG: hypothetical protein COC16_03905 [Lutibacter sp.]
MSIQQKQIEDLLSFFEQNNKEILGYEFIKKTAEYLGKLINVSYISICKFSIKNPDITETVIIYTKNGFAPNISYKLAHTPCENVINKNLCVYPNNIQVLFPKDELLTQMNVESYIGMPLWSSKGEPIGLIAILDDKPIKDSKTFEIILQIVALKLAQALEKSIYENKLKRQEENYEQLFEKSPTSLWKIDFTGAHKIAQNLINSGVNNVEKHLKKNPDFLIECLKNLKIKYLNKASVHLFNAKSKEHLLKNIKKIANKDTFLHYQKILIEILQGKTEIIHEVSFTNLKDEIIFGIIKLNLTKNFETNKVTANIFILDITKQKESEERYRALSESSFEAIFLSEKGVWLETNATAEKMFGYTRAEIIELKATDIIVSKDHELVMKNIQSGYERLYEVTAVRKDGTTFPAQIKARTIYYKGRDVRVSSVINLTQSKQLENIVKESEEKFKKLSNLTFEGVLIHDKGIAKDINLSFEKMFGYCRKELIEKNIINLLFPKKYHDQIIKNIEKKIAHTYEIEGIRKDGSIFPVEIEARDIITKENNKLRVSAIRDISERKKLETEAIKLSTAVEQSSNSIMITDLDGNIEYTNPKFTELTGYSAEEAQGKNPSMLSSGAQSKEYYAEMWQSISVGKTWHGQFQNKAKKGHLFWEQVTITPIKNREGKTINYLTIKEDITKRKKAEEKLKKAYETIKEKEGYLRMVLKTSEEGFWVVDTKGKTLTLNPKMYKILGYAKRDVIGKSIFNFVDTSNAKIFKEQLKKRENGESSSYEIELLGKNKKIISCLFKTAPIYDKENIRVGSFAMVTDISKLKNAYNKLETNYNEQKELSFALSEKNRMLFESQDKFKNLFEQSPVSLWEVDFSEVKKLLKKKLTATNDLKNYLDENPDFVNLCVSKINILNVNTKTLQLLGLHKKEELKKHLNKNNTKKSLEALKKEFLAIASDKIEFTTETKYIKTDGSIINAILKSVLIDSEGRKLVSVIDITASRNAEQEIRDSEYFLNETQKIAKIGSYSLEFKTGLWKSSKLLNNIFGIDDKYKKDYSGWTDILHPEDRMMMQEYFEANIAKNHEFFNKEYRIIRVSDKKMRWMHGFGQLRFDKSGNLLKMIGTIQDITARKEAENQIILAKEKIEKSEKKFRELYEKSGDAILIIENGVFVECNQATVKMLNYNSKEDLLNVHPSKLSPKKQPDGLESHEKAEEMMKISLIKGTHRFEWIHTKKNGESIPVEALLTAISNDPNKKIIHCVWRDITERSKNEKEIIKAKEDAEKSTKRFKTIFSEAPLGIGLVDSVTGQMKEANEMFGKIIGRDHKKLTDIKWASFTHPDDLEADYKHMSQINSGKINGFQIEKRYIRSDGSVVWVKLTVSALNEKSQKMKRHLAMIEDITERKQYDLQLEEKNEKIKGQNIEYKKVNLELKNAKEKAEESEELTRSITESAPNAIITINSKGLVMSWNKASENIFGFTSSEMKNKKLDKIIPTQFRTKHENRIISIKQGEKEKLSGKTIELVGLRKDGTEFPIELSLTSWKMGDEKCFTGIVRDITDEKEAKEKLIVAKEKAEESDRLKIEFLNNMSHEIRTPMNGILGFSQLLNNPDLSVEKRTNFTSIIQNCGKQLLHIIDDILEISRLGTKQVKVIEEEVCLNDALLELFSIFDIKAKENKTPLYLKKSLSNKQSTIFIDKTKLIKIISNLLENALKFTNQGFIEFGYNLKKRGDKEVLEIYVKDSGIGIKPEKHQLIFERFSQAEKELSKNVGGLGLGLSIAKENTELLGGEISVKSKIMEGATFLVTIPYKPVNLSTNNSIQNNHLEKKAKYTILIAEDEEVNYLFLEIILTEKMKLNCSILHAKDGLEAVEMCKNNSDIDFVFMDIRMPRMNGYEATKQIKKMQPNLPIIALTAYSTSEDREKAMAAGCSDFISKPIKKELLLKTVDKVLKEKIS